MSAATTELHSDVATTFDVLSWELELAGARCIFLDTLIGKLLMTVPPEHREQLLEGVQAVDLLSQHLTGLSTFARGLSQTVEARETIGVTAALKSITLGALADRMTTSFGGEEAGLNDGDDAGDLDLF
ncbi:hypothetical protein [Caulobacter sp. DWR2-3-1b2]|uniref:hypothetical protein n=1 Tax=unclassified Caulobacter TaxID=2648921 RepID=UPI003CEFE8F3